MNMHTIVNCIMMEVIHTECTICTISMVLFINKVTSHNIRRLQVYDFLLCNPSEEHMSDSSLFSFYLFLQGL